VDRAEKTYGVVFRPGGWEVDAEATAALRETLKAAKKEGRNE
jgi:hypothetical protein